MKIGLLGFGVVGRGVYDLTAEREDMRVAKVVNLARCIDELKEQGLWIYAADMGGKAHYDTDMKGGVGLVLGSEGFGISRLVKEKCDFVVSIP